MSEFNETGSISLINQYTPGRYINESKIKFVTGSELHNYYQILHNSRVYDCNYL